MITGQLVLFFSFTVTSDFFVRSAIAILPEANPCNKSWNTFVVY